MIGAAPRCRVNSKKVPDKKKEPDGLTNDAKSSAWDKIKSELVIERSIDRVLPPEISRAKTQFENNSSSIVSLSTPSRPTSAWKKVNFDLSNSDTKMKGDNDANEISISVWSTLNKDEVNEESSRVEGLKTIIKTKSKWNKIKNDAVTFSENTSEVTVGRNFYSKANFESKRNLNTAATATTAAENIKVLAPGKISTLTQILIAKNKFKGKTKDTSKNYLVMNAKFDEKNVSMCNKAKKDTPKSDKSVTSQEEAPKLQLQKNHRRIKTVAASFLAWKRVKGNASEKKMEGKEIAIEEGTETSEEDDPSRLENPHLINYDTQCSKSLQDFSSSKLDNEYRRSKLENGHQSSTLDIMSEISKNGNIYQLPKLSYNYHNLNLDSDESVKILDSINEVEPSYKPVLTRNEEIFCIRKPNQGTNQIGYENISQDRSGSNKSCVFISAKSSTTTAIVEKSKSSLEYDVLVTLNLRRTLSSVVPLDDIFSIKDFELKESGEVALNECIEDLINHSLDLHSGVKRSMFRCLEHNYYYIYFCLNGKKYEYDSKKASKYFRYCIRKNVTPNLFVDFLNSYLTNPAAACETYLGRKL